MTCDPISIIYKILPWGKYIYLIQLCETLQYYISHQNSNSVQMYGGWKMVYWEIVPHI